MLNCSIADKLYFLCDKKDMYPVKTALELSPRILLGTFLSLDNFLNKFCVRLLIIKKRVNKMRETS